MESSSYFSQLLLSRHAALRAKGASSACLRRQTCVAAPARAGRILRSVIAPRARVLGAVTLMVTLAGASCKEDSGNEAALLAALAASGGCPSYNWNLPAGIPEPVEEKPRGPDSSKDQWMYVGEFGNWVWKRDAS